jgi:2-phosphosulfolactate phosphatase
MQIVRVDRTTVAQARGVVIVVDVIRAFSVVGYAFAGGARGLWLVRTVEEALALREHEPGALLAGEVGGRLIPGFDLNNSPDCMAKADVRGRLLIQRTGAGTQGAVDAANASYILPCALTNARATANYATALATPTEETIALLPTGTSNDFTYGNEDVICADYVEALLQGRADAAESLARDIAQLRVSGRFDWWEQGDKDFPVEDIAAVLDVDRFDFALLGTRKEWQGITYVEVQPVQFA